MALSVVQDKIGNPVDNVDTTSLSFASTPAAGNLVVVCIEGWRSSGSGGFEVPAGSVTDNQGNTYTQAVTVKTNSVVRSAIFYAYNVTASGTFTVTVDPTGTGNYLSWSLTEVGGATTTDPLDKTVSNTSGGTTPGTGSTAALSQANEIVFAVIGCFTGSVTSVTVESVSPAWVEIFEQTDGVNEIPGEVDRRIVAATTAQACNWTLGVAPSGSAMVLATFKEAAASAASSLIERSFRGLQRGRFRGMR